MEIQKRFKDFINGSDSVIDFNNSKDYYYALGQFAYFIETCSIDSKTHLTMNRLNQYIYKSRIGKLHDYLVQKMKRYGHLISLDNNKIRLVLTNLLNVDPPDIDELSFNIGVLSDNVLS